MCRVCAWRGSPPWVEGCGRIVAGSGRGECSSAHLPAASSGSAWSPWTQPSLSAVPHVGFLCVGHRDVNTTIMELLIMVYACKTSCAKSITGVLPYFPYSKQCKMRKRGSIVSKLLASMMCKAGEPQTQTQPLLPSPRACNGQG